MYLIYVDKRSMWYYYQVRGENRNWVGGVVRKYVELKSELKSFFSFKNKR